MIIEVYSAHGGGRYWQRLLQEWRDAGHAIHENYAFDDVTYRRKKGRFAHIWLRLMTYAIFPLKVWLKLWWAGYKADTVRVVISSPFFLPFVVTWPPRFRKKTPTVYVLNDLYPDALVHAGMLKHGGWLERQLRRLPQYCFRQCEATIFLGSHLKTYAEEAYGRSKMGRIIPVGSDATFVGNSAPTPISAGGPIDILYSGTMGHMHEIDTMLEVIRQGSPQRIHFTFHSSGVGYARFCRGITNLGNETSSNIALRGPLPDDIWSETLRRSPIGLVTLKAGAQNVSMPSKTYSALAAGQAILAICPIDSDLAELVLAHNCGWVVAPGRADELKSLLVRLEEHPEEIYAKRLEAYRAGHSLYDMAAISRQYIELFDILRGTEI